LQNESHLRDISCQIRFRPALLESERLNNAKKNTTSAILALLYSVHCTTSYR